MIYRVFIFIISLLVIDQKIMRLHLNQVNYEFYELTSTK